MISEAAANRFWPQQDVIGRRLQLVTGEDTTSLATLAVVHVCTAVVGRPFDFFNEGIAVSFRTDPARGDFTVRFGHPSSSDGPQVHDASREYLRSGSLPLPVSRYVTTSGFRAISDQVLSYYICGLVRPAPHGALRTVDGAPLF